MSLSAIAKQLKDKPEETIAVLVGTVTDDERLLDIPKMTVAALRFTASARARIIKAGGEALTIDQLAQRAPTGSHTLLLRGKKNARKAVKYFGVPGARHSTTKARVRSEGRKFSERRK